MEIILGIFENCWEILAESAPYVLFGFFAAGLLKALLPEDAVARHLGKNNTSSVLKASLFGIPLPLCSCGVIPAAVGLRKQGASKGASAAFLISVPETGVDSIAITWALLDPIMTIIRPLSAFLTATATGLLINRLPDDIQVDSAKTPACGCGAEQCVETSLKIRPSLLHRLLAGQAYAFGDFLGDIGKWLMLGIVVAGVIAYLIPDDFFVRYMGNELTSLLIMLGVGVPLYICASASTPIAAALVLKGLSPGAALVFLLAGPATNAAAITVVWKFWGKAATIIYLASIALCSLMLGWLTNRLYGLIGLDIADWIQPGAEAAVSPIAAAAAVILLLLLIRSILSKRNASGGCCEKEAS